MGVRAAVLDTTSADPGDPGDPADPAASSKNADLIAIRVTSELARSQNRTWHPMGSHRGQWDPMGSKWSPIGSQFDLIWIQFEPNWAHLGTIYIHKLPINRPSGRYVIEQASLFTAAPVGGE